MTWLTKLRSEIVAVLTYSPFKDCSQGNMYERSAAYRFNCAHKHLLLHRAAHMFFAAVVFYGVGLLTEMHAMIWFYVLAYIAVAMCLIQIPIMLYGYLYLSKWAQWNGTIK